MTEVEHVSWNPWMDWKAKCPHSTNQSRKPPESTFSDRNHIVWTLQFKAKCPKRLLSAVLEAVHPMSHDRDAVEFNNLLDQFGLVQHVSDATHRGVHTLDLVLSRSQDTIVQDTHAEDHGFPDHYPVFVRLLTERPANPIHTVCYRKIKSINLNAVVKDMHDSLLVGDHSEQPLDQLVSIYQNELLAVLMTTSTPR